jgi:hypothetical protein
VVQVQHPGRAAHPSIEAEVPVYPVLAYRPDI